MTIRNLILILFLALASTSYAGNTPNGASSLEQVGTWMGDQLGSYISSGCLPTVPASSMTLAPLACRGAIRLSTGALRYVNQTAVPITLTGANGRFFLALHSDQQTAVTGWTRTVGSHYLWQRFTGTSAQVPTAPANTQIVAEMTVAGSVVTAVQDWRHPASFARSGVYDITDPLYGAVGDGTIDDTAAIQAALNAGGGRVTCPTGSYKITATLTITRGLVFAGIGPSPGAVSTTDPAWPGCVLEHHFSGTFIDIPGVSAQVQTGVGPTLDNLILRQKFGTGSGAAGVAINIVATSDSFKASWVKIHNINTEYSVGSVDDWTWVVVMDGDATSSTSTGGSRNHAIEGGRLYGGPQSTGAIKIHAGANIHITDTLVQGENGHVEISGSDDPHFSSNTALTGVALNGNLLLGHASGTTCSGCQVAGLVTTANTALTSYFGAVAAGGVTLVGLNPYSIIMTNNKSYVLGGAQQELHLSSPTALGTILGLGQDGVDKWRFVVAGGSGDFAFTGPSSLAIYDLNQSGGMTTRRAIGANVNVLTYGASVAVDATLGNEWRLSVTDGSPFTIANATSPVIGQRLTFAVVNNNATALGTLTWDTKYQLAGAWVQPAPGYYRSITFRVDSSTKYHELNRAAADALD